MGGMLDLLHRYTNVYQVYLYTHVKQHTHTLADHDFKLTET